MMYVVEKKYNNIKRKQHCMKTKYLEVKYMKDKCCNRSVVSKRYLP